MANAVRELPQSVRLWLKAAELESSEDIQARRRVIRKALENVPHSVKLWKAAIDLEEDQDDARLLLSRAVECVPMAVELWLALSRLETYDNAKRVLNRARAACPTSPDIWVAAARLEESVDHLDRVPMLLQRAMSDLDAKGANWTRERWLQEAETCEQGGSVHCVQAIIRCLLTRERHPSRENEEDHEGREGRVEEDEEEDLEELIDQWLDDAKAATDHGALETARAIHAFILEQDSTQAFIWQKIAFFEKEHGTEAQLTAMMERAVTACPQEEILWLMAAKWSANQVDRARTILQRAFQANPNSEKIWLAAVKLEQDLGEHERARALLTKAREEASTERVWLRAIVLERNLGHGKAAQALLTGALERYPTFAKFWLIQAQLDEHDTIHHGIDTKTEPNNVNNTNNVNKARRTFTQACQHCPQSIPLWLEFSRLEERQHNLTRCRAILDKARLLHPQEPLLWQEMIRLEQRHQPTLHTARTLLAQSLQQCPHSGLLWSLAIELEPRPSRKSKSVDALKACTDQDPHVLLAISRLFWSERRLDKCRSWLERTCRLKPDWGDAWAYWYKWECEYGTPDSQHQVQTACQQAEPRYGEYWQPMAKHPTHWQWSTDTILKHVSHQVPLLE